MEARRALVRRPSPRLAEGLVTHLERQPVDLDLALAQWDGYVAALHDAGWQTIEVPPADDCPDGVFVEDTVVMYGDRAVITRPGADERKPETAATAAVLARLRVRRGADRGARHPRRRRRAQARRHGLGRARRPHQRRRRRAAGGVPRAVRRDGGRRTGAEGAAPQVGGHRAARRHRDRLPAAGRRPGRVAVVPRRARGGRLARRPARRRRRADEHQRPVDPGAARGARARVVAVDLTEYEKLEGCVTCLSVRLRQTP